MGSQTRRAFYESLLSGLGSIIVLGLSLPATAYLFVTRRSLKKEGFVKVADLARLQLGIPQEVVFERTRVDGWRTYKENGFAWVVLTSGNNVVASVHAFGLVERALRQSGGNKTRAAEILAVHRRLLYEKLREYGLESE